MDIKKTLEEIDQLLSAMEVKGDNVLILANIRIKLKDLYEEIKK